MFSLVEVFHGNAFQLPQGRQDGDNERALFLGREREEEIKSFFKPFEMIGRRIPSTLMRNKFVETGEVKGQKSELLQIGVAVTPAGASMSKDRALNTRSAISSAPMPLGDSSNALRSAERSVVRRTNSLKCPD